MYSSTQKCRRCLFTWLAGQKACIICCKAGVGSCYHHPALPSIYKPPTCARLVTVFCCRPCHLWNVCLCIDILVLLNVVTRVILQSFCLTFFPLYCEFPVFFGLTFIADALLILCIYELYKGFIQKFVDIQKSASLFLIVETPGLLLLSSCSIRELSEMVQVFVSYVSLYAFSALTLLVGWQEGIRPVKN